MILKVINREDAVFQLAVIFYFVCNFSSAACYVHRTKDQEVDYGTMRTICIFLFSIFLFHI